jgi:hypothetical protein
VSGRCTRRDRCRTDRGDGGRRRRGCCLSGRDKFLRRGVGWGCCFRSDLGPGAFRGRTIGNGCPAVFNVHFRDAFLHAARPNNITNVAQNRNGNFELAAANSRLPLRITVTSQTIALDRPLTARTHFVKTGSFVHDRRVRESDPGDVLRFNYDGDVSLGRNHGLTEVFGTEIVRGHERVLVGPDVVITVRPVLDSAASIEPGFGR